MPKGLINVDGCLFHFQFFVCQMSQLVSHALLDAGQAVGLGFMKGFFQCITEADRIGTAVAFNHHTAQAEEYGAVEFARIQLDRKSTRLNSSHT